MRHQYIKKEAEKILKIIEESVSIVYLANCLLRLSEINCKKAHYYRMKIVVIQIEVVWLIYNPADNRKENSKGKGNAYDLYLSGEGI